MEPKNASFIIKRADAKIAHGDLDGALADYDLTTELDPKVALAYRKRSSAKEKKGDRDGSMPTSGTRVIWKTPKRD